MGKKIGSDKMITLLLLFMVAGIVTLFLWAADWQPVKAATFIGAALVAFGVIIAVLDIALHLLIFLVRRFR